MQTLASSRDLDAVLAAESALLFKNSTTCPISAAARHEMQRLLEQRPDAPLLVVDVNAHADLSREIARRTGIEHDSPQIILLTHGVPRWYASHYAIHAGDVAHELDALVADRDAA